MTNISVNVALPPSSQKETSHSTLLKNIMSINNIRYSTSNMRVWRQYGIGEGKLINNIPDSNIYPELQAVQVYDGQVKARKEKSNYNCPGTTVQMSADSTNTTMVEDDVFENDGLFGCIAQKNFIEHKVVKSTTLNALTVDSSDTCLTSKLSKGWALKLKRGSQKFTESQKKFMTDKFEIGERSGQKCDPEDMSTLMRSVKDEQGSRLFKQVEFLSASQIASFFSRLALKKKKNKPSRLQ
ncbi:unnamed protein product [Mytilus edulis]|uniref:Uncharacterized protein n=1 Tax=Mytilus edulis TaxID=6550 RepID=A0A8S3UEZ7_MYTED|nr:unnamed protein product [Mytilus edulis]